MKGAFKLEFSQEELKLIKGCILTTIETLKVIPFKSKEIKNKLAELEKLELKFRERF